MNISSYISDLPDDLLQLEPWVALGKFSEIIYAIIPRLGDDYTVIDGVAIHSSATVDASATIKAPAIVGPSCFVGGHALIREGVYLAESVSIGPGCEVRRAYIGRNSACAHFNFIGDSILGARVNLEAGAIIANHYNEREDKSITLKIDGQIIETGLDKFGAIISDDTKIGANAVVSPGIVLKPGSIVKRLELIEQP